MMAMKLGSPPLEPTPLHVLLTELQRARTLRQQSNIAAKLARRGREGIEALCAHAPFDRHIELRHHRQLANGRRSSEPVLLDLADVLRAQPRFYALRALAHMRSVAAQPLFERIARDRTEPREARVIAIEALVIMQRHDLMGTFCQMAILRTEEACVRIACVDAIRALGLEELLKARVAPNAFPPPPRPPSIP